MCDWPLLSLFGPSCLFSNSEKQKKEDRGAKDDKRTRQRGSRGIKEGYYYGRGREQRKKRMKKKKAARRPFSSNSHRLIHVCCLFRTRSSSCQDLGCMYTSYKDKAKKNHRQTHFSSSASPSFRYNEDFSLIFSFLLFLFFWISSSQLFFFFSSSLQWGLHQAQETSRFHTWFLSSLSLLFFLVFLVFSPSSFSLHL